MHCDRAMEEDRTGWICIGVLGGGEEDFVQLASWCSHSTSPFFGYDASFAYRPLPSVKGWPQDLVKVVEDEDSRTCWVWVDLQPPMHPALGGVPGTTGWNAAHKSLQGHERASLQALLLLFLTAHVVILLHEGQQFKVPLLGKLRALQAAKFQLWHKLGLGKSGLSESQSVSDRDEDEDEDEQEDQKDVGCLTDAAEGGVANQSAELLKKILLQSPPMLFCMFQVETMHPLSIQDMDSWQAELNAQVKALFLRCRVLPASQAQPLLFSLHPQQAAVLVPALTPSAMSMHHDYLGVLTTSNRQQSGPSGPQKQEQWTLDSALEDLQLLLEPSRNYAQDIAAVTGVGGALSWAAALDTWPSIAGSLQAVHRGAAADLRAPLYFTTPLRAPIGRKVKTGQDHATDPSGRFLDACTGLAYRFSAVKCRKALLAAWDTYCKDLPLAYTQAVHEGAVQAALHVFDAIAVGPASSEYHKQLLADCWAEWNDGRRLCGAVSLTGWPCLLGPHQELGHGDKHSSGKEWVLAPGAGTVLQTYPDPFDFTVAVTLLTHLKSDIKKASPTEHTADELGLTATVTRQDTSRLCQVQITLTEYRSTPSDPAATNQGTTTTTAPNPALQLQPHPVVKAMTSAKNDAPQAAAGPGARDAARRQGRLQKQSPAAVLVKDSAAAAAAAGVGSGAAGVANVSNVVGGLEVKGGREQQEEKKGREIVKGPITLGPCMSLWTHGSAADYDPQLGLQWPGFLPSLNTLIPLQLQLEVVQADDSQGVLSASHFPTLAESLSARKHFTAGGVGDASPAVMQYTIRNWPSHETNPGNTTSSSTTTTSGSTKSHVLAVPRRGVGRQAAGGRSKGQGRADTSEASRSHNTHDAPMFIGLEYGNWLGQRFLASPSMLGYTDPPAADKDTDQQLGGQDKGRHKGRVREADVKEGTGRAGAGHHGVTPGLSAAHHILSHDIPLFLEPANLPYKNEPSGDPVGKQTASQRLPTRFQLHRIHVITPDVPLTFCSKPIVQFDLPEDRGKWCNQVDQSAASAANMAIPASKPSMTGASIPGSSHATGSLPLPTYPLSSNLPAKSEMSGVKPASGAPDDPGSRQLRRSGTSGPSGPDCSSAQVAFAAVDEIVLQQGCYSVVVLPLVYGLPKRWLGGDIEQDIVQGCTTEEGGGSQGPLLSLLCSEGYNAVLKKGSMLYPKLS